MAEVNFYKPDGADSEDFRDPEKPKSKGVTTWEASEYIEHHHGAGWYAGLVVVTAAIATIVYLITRSYIATTFIVIVGIIVGFFVRQKPRQVKYEINRDGISIDDKLFPYRDYKSFTIIHETGLTSVNFFPLKRLKPPLTAFFEPPQEQAIVNALQDYLPYENRKLDSIDRLSRRLRL